LHSSIESASEKRRHTSQRQPMRPLGKSTD
jgi:hypothetical protein